MTFVESRKYNWEIHENPEDTKKIADKLKVFLEKKDLKGVVSILKDPYNSRSFITRRGHGNEYIENLLKGFSFVFGVENWMNLEFNEKNIDLLHQKNIPERLLIEIMAATYRFRQEKLFFSIRNTVLNNQDKIRDAEVIAGVYHEFAAWLAEVNKDWEGAVGVNRQAIDMTKKFGFKLLENKILFGLSLNKGRRNIRQIKPKDKIDDFAKFAENFRNLGDCYDAARADLEKIGAMVELAIRKNKEDRKKLLEEALKLCKKAQIEIKEIEYPNALVMAKELLSNIYLKLEKDNIAAKYKKEADNLRKFYDYHFSKKDI